ncbi:sigma-70 family RNA polymerase sigma factor [Alkalithermobacter paradoxus]|uniref:RNA polymerase sigma factor RpoH n=1 Tax=Alkalithermobacter paradoxus TaxID=29349 RepID=A0A1V4I5R0_9FIRM|nr:RNA polymerase sigma factor RpoH [[Clostridium] thermoalcaliphilum]
MCTYEEINNLVKLSNKGCKTSLESLITTLKPLIISKCKHYFGYVNEDLYSDGILRSIELIKNFDFEKNTKFLGYMEYMLSCFYWDKKRKLLKESENEMLIDDSIEHSYEEDYSFIDIEECLSMLNDKERYIITQHILNGDTLVNISKNLNISYKYTKSLKSKAIKKLNIFFST